MEEVRQRLMYSQSLEAARCVAEGIVSPRDADVGSLLGWGFPSVLGGALGLNAIPAYTNIFWVLACVAITLYTVLALLHSTYGRGFLAVHDDEIAAAPWEQELYRMGAPEGMEVRFVTVDEAAVALPGYQADARAGMLLTSDVATMVRLIDAARITELEPPRLNLLWVLFCDLATRSLIVKASP